ncbi:PAS-domain containing protein [Muricoccus radiodurans]|uniref:PAS-domain containing protein n=1 Tax=Muricoccus radiodurans TaxID=2231721 RepID=UPI003CF318C1
MSDPASPPAPFRSALDALAAGVSIYDAEGRLAYANPALWRQAGVDPLPPGTPIAEVVACLAASGHYGPGDPNRRIATIARLDRSRPRRHLTRNNAGRWHELTSHPLPEGGSIGLSVDVTQAHRSDSEAATRAALLESILEGLAGGVAEYDHHSRLRYFNPAYRALIGAPSSALQLGMTLAEVYALLEAVGQLSTLSHEELLGLPRTRLDGPRDTTRTRPDGTVLWGRIRPFPEGGHLVEVSDITAVRRAEAEARERAALLNGVLSAIPHGVCVYGPDGRVTMVNAAYQRIMAGSEVRIGESHDEITARRIAEGEYGGETPEAVRAALANFRQPIANDRIRTRPNGTVLSIRVARLPNGGHVTVMTDITARHRAEEEARRRAETLRNMLENQPDGIALFDPAGMLIASNALAARMIGLTPEEMAPGQHLLDLRGRQLLGPEFGTTEEERQAFIASRPMAIHRERYIRRRPDGTLLEVRTDPTPDGGFIRTYRDVTEERRIRSELEAARDAAEAASRAKTRFLATMTHELRTPLHAVIGFSEAIREETRAEVMRAHAAEVLEAGRQLLGLVDGILEASRIEAGLLSAGGTLFDPAPVLRAAAATVAPAADELGIALDMDIPRRLPHLRGEPARLQRVLDALLSNAIKFTPSGGRVLLAAEAPKGGEGVTKVRVTDTGIGMAPESIPRAFEAFVQLESGLSRRYPGSGLGLYLARAAAESMGMALTLESAPGAGTTARLEMPVASKEAVKERSAHE